MFENMGGNIPGGNLLRGNFPGGNFPRGSLMGVNFPGESFPDTILYKLLVEIIPIKSC